MWVNIYCTETKIQEIVFNLILTIAVIHRTTAYSYELIACKLRWEKICKMWFFIPFYFWSTFIYLYKIFITAANWKNGIFEKNIDTVSSDQFQIPFKYKWIPYIRLSSVYSVPKSSWNIDIKRIINVRRSWTFIIKMPTHSFHYMVHCGCTVRVH